MQHFGLTQMKAKWMGWLNVASEKSEVPRIEALANEIKAAGFYRYCVDGNGWFKSLSCDDG